VTVRRNDLRRLAGYEFVDVIGRNKDNIEHDVVMGKALATLIEEPVVKMTALFTAAMANDVKTIDMLSTLGGGVNPNVQQPETGYTALHMAVSRRHDEAVYALVNSFSRTIDLQRQDYIRGETPLHLASRNGFNDIVAILCDSELCDPAAVRDNRGQLAIEVNANHKCFQFIRAATERNVLMNELAILKLTK
jgi:ankyrin repeat protein